MSRFNSGPFFITNDVFIIIIILWLFFYRTLHPYLLRKTPIHSCTSLRNGVPNFFVVLCFPTCWATIWPAYPEHKRDTGWDDAPSPTTRLQERVASQPERQLSTMWRRFSVVLCACLWKTFHPSLLFLWAGAVSMRTEERGACHEGWNKLLPKCWFCFTLHTN